MFPRKKYYSQTEILKAFKVSPKALKMLLDEHHVNVVRKEVSLGEYTVTTAYVLKVDIEKLNLQPRPPSVSRI